MKNIKKILAGSTALLMAFGVVGCGKSDGSSEESYEQKVEVDTEAVKDTTEGMYTLGQAISKGFHDSWGDIDQWEQFVIGGLTGMAGTYMPTKLFNQDKTKSKWDPRRYGEWSGGAINEVREFNKQYNQFNENVNDLNSILSKEDFFERARDFVGHTYTETKKNEALENGDKKIWKDEEDKQIIHDIQAFYRAGKIDDLRAIYDEMGKNLSDDDVQNIIKSSTMETTDDEGKTKYIGAFVDENGNQIVSNDQIREEVKHNSEKLNEKLDSYLDSVQAVYEDTGGRLTKDQEDNLAYLHNLGKESNKRFLDTISNRRKDMPQKFLFKTNKTPEQLTEEYVSSDLVFEKNSNTPEGYVEANTSLMTDNAFANFFMREIMWGGNISPDFGKTIDEKDSEDKNLSEEEKKKKAMERFTAKLKEVEEKQKKEQEDQQVANIKRMKKEFIDNYRQNNDATVDEALSAWNELKQDVIDASDLLNQAGQYRLTLSEYLTNPQKVAEDKKKEEDKAEKKAEKEQVKGMSVRDLSNRDDLDSLLTQAQEEKDIDLINKIKRAKVLREKRAGLDAVESDTESYKDLDPSDVGAAFQILRKQVEDDIDDSSDASEVEQKISELIDKVADVDEGNISAHVDKHAIVNINPKTGQKTLALKKDEINAAEEAQVVQFMNENPEEYERQRNILIDRIHNSIKSIDDRLNKALQQIDTDDIDEEGTAKLKKYSDKIKEEENLPDIEPEKKKDRNAPVQTVVSKPVEVTEKKPIDGVSSEEALISDMQQSTTDGMQTPFDSGQHPWYSVSGRVGYHSNEPFSETLRKIIEDPNVSEEKKAAYRKQYDRCVAVEDFLEKNGAYTRVENGGAKKGKAKFKVFKSVNDKAKDFVIFITDEQGRVLGDLPSSDIDIDPNTEKRVGLAELYEEARKQFEEANTEEYELKGIETEIDFVYIGKPQYQEERQSVNNLFGENTFTLAIKVADTNVDSPVAFLDTGKKSLQGKLEKDAIREPLTGTLGQPYVLIPTSQATNKNNYGRGYFAVPIATPTFGEIDKNSIFYRTVRQTLEQIRDGKLSETEAKTKLGELFGLANFHVNFENKESRKGAGISATTYIRQDGSEKGAPHTLHIGDRTSMNVDAILNELGRFFINISNSQINSSKTYTTIEGVAYTYNQMIGEIAQTNVARPHTVNDWFTIKSVEKKDGKWQVSKTPTQRIPYPSGSNNSVFNVSVPYQDGTTHIWTISPKDWIVRDEQGRPIYQNDSIHSDAEVSVAAIYMAKAFGRYYMKDMNKPYVVQVGNQARLFDPKTNTFKSAKELEETPKYRKGASFNSLEDEYNYLMALEADMIEGYETAKAQKAVTQQPAEKNTKVEIIFKEKFGTDITDYSYGAQDKYPTFYGILPSTGERVRVDIDTKNNRYTIWIDRALPGEMNYKPGKGISYNILVEEGEEAYNKALQELGLPKEFIEAIPKLNELWSEDVKNETDTHDKYLEKEWGIVYGHNAPNYKEEKKKAENRKKVEDTIGRIKADSENYVLTDAKGNENPNGAYYKDKRTEQLHARVTSVKEGDTRVQPFNETDAEGKPNVWILPSTTIGNAVDKFVRAFFAGEDVETSPLAQNLSEETKKHLREELEKIKTSAEKGGWKIVSNGIVASGTIMVKDANGDKMAIRVAGTLDLLLYNSEKDEYAIYDMKTHRSAVDNQKELDWAAQLSLYKQLLEIKFPELRGKIKALRIIPFSTSGYDANKQNYDKDSEGRLTSNGEIVKVNVKYDGKTIDLTDKEMNLDISFARPGFKKEYVEGEGAQKIIVSKPQPKLGEAPKARVKEGIVKTINKIEAKDSVKTFLKHSFEENKEALQLVEVLDKARKDGTLGELCLTEGTMNLLEDMLDTKKIDRIAGFAVLDKKGINVQEELPDVEAQEEDVDTIAENKGILNSSTKNAWNKLTPENKEKIVKLKRGLNSIKKELKECQKLGKDPNSVIGGYLHRKANETSGYTVIDMKKELSWLNRVLPKLSRENKLKIVEGLIKCSDGTWDYGQMKQGLIYIASNGKEGTIYHEAFHAVTQWILTDMELDSLYKAAKERYGNLDTVTLEEKLADDFMRYTMGFEPSYKRNDLNILQKLWQAIKSIFKNTSIIDQLYRDINDGVYADRVLRTENNEFAHIDSSDRQVSMKYNFLDSEQKQILKAGNVNQQQYEVLDTDEKKYLFHCVL